jgi:pSer/pThr/pTyr-binding forkhead associated (FHA) protein
MEVCTMATLKIMSGIQEGQSCLVDRDEMSMGRATDNVIPIDDGSVSGHHAVVVREGRRFLLRDLGSTNGSRLNGVKVDEVQLSSGDLFCVGSISILIEGDDIEPSVQDEIPPTVVHAPVESKEANVSSSAPPSGAFQAKKRSGGIFTTVGIFLLVVLVGLLVWFAFGLFTK